jgi:hypothetical protein
MMRGWPSRWFIPSSLHQLDPSLISTNLSASPVGCLSESMHNDREGHGPASGLVYPFLLTPARPLSHLSASPVGCLSESMHNDREGHGPATGAAG